MFRLDGFHIDNTRAVDEDTDHVSFAVKVGDQMVGEPIIRHVGDVDNGDHPLGIEIGPIVVPARDTPISFNYQIINSGHGNQSDIERQLISGATALLTKVFGAGTPWALVAGAVINLLAGLFDANCDGPVAVDQISVRGETLWSWTAGVGTHSETRFYPGTDSPVGCGSNSEYTVTWSVVGAGIVPPNLAEELLNRASLNA
jgi:hypothetical protein